MKATILVLTILFAVATALPSVALAGNGRGGGDDSPTMPGNGRTGGGDSPTMPGDGHTGGGD